MIGSIIVKLFSPGEAIFVVANSLNPDQARQNVGLNLGPNCLTFSWYS